MVDSSCELGSVERDETLMGSLGELRAEKDPDDLDEDDLDEDDLDDDDDDDEDDDDEDDDDDLIDLDDEFDDTGDEDRPHPGRFDE